MSPAAIVRRARELRLDLIAVTDHNSVLNGFVAAEIGLRCGLQVLYGMEAQTREDVHVLCLFADRRQAEKFNDRVYALLPDVKNNPDYFGDQVLVDAEDNVVRQEEKLLLNALQASIPELLELVRLHDGVAIPAHVEAPPYGLLVNLGMVPAEFSASVLEISCAARAEEVRRTFPDLARFPLISSSDAHFLRDIGRARTVFESPSRSLPELITAARGNAFQVLYAEPHG
jgi:predicted metal-dependent phosphoesterase TrpH